MKTTLASSAKEMRTISKRKKKKKKKKNKNSHDENLLEAFGIGIYLKTSLRQA
jgi:hypothetical protein